MSSSLKACVKTPTLYGKKKNDEPYPVVSTYSKNERRPNIGRNFLVNRLKNMTGQGRKEP
jgi:hypothetical protein